ncbi:MAG: outer membrane protein assembly factor BamD [Tepidisphaeraceae bacterium]|jgi:outer membrane assembly lipoprotein YfiO
MGLSLRLRPRHAFALLVLLTASVSFGQKRTWEYDNGKWPQVNDDTAQPVSDPEIDRAEQYLAKGDPNSARQILLAWEHVHKDSPVRDRAIFLIAQSYYQQDDRILAFYYLDEVMDEYPESRLFYPALQKQYEIADDFLAGHKRRFFGIPLLTAEDEAVEMLYRIQQRSPGSDLAEKALLRTCDYYYNSGQFDFAADAYAAFVRGYPRSKDVPRARLRQAFSNLAQFRGLQFDATPIIDARAQLLDIEREYPNLADDENVQPVIEQIDSAFAAKLLVTGAFYERTGQPKAAVYTYRFLIDTYASSPEAAQAKVRVARLPEWAKGPPYPPRAEGYAPATQPVGETPAAGVVK